MKTCDESDVLIAVGNSVTRDASALVDGWAWMCSAVELCVG